MKILSFAVDKVNSVNDLKRLLELETSIPANEQEILLPRGVSPIPEKDVSQFLSNMVCITFIVKFNFLFIMILNLFYSTYNNFKSYT